MVLVGLEGDTATCPSTLFGLLCHDLGWVDAGTTYRTVKMSST